jgi:hypothetical protein
MVLPATEQLAPDLSELVEAISRRSDKFRKGGVCTSVRKIFLTLWEQEEAVRLFGELSHDQIIRAALENEPISLSAARQMSARLNTPLSFLLDGHAGTGVFTFVLENCVPRPARKTKKKLNVENLRVAFEAVLAENHEPPLSLCAIATRLDVTQNALRYHFPSKSAMVVANWSTYRASKPERCKREAITLARSLLSTWHESRTELLTKKSFLRVLRSRSAFPKNLLRAVIEVVLDGDLVRKSTSSGQRPSLDPVPLAAGSADLEDSRR